MARVSRRRVAREVVRLLTQQPERQAQVMQQLAGYVIANKMLSQLDLLLLDIEDELYLQQGHVEARVMHALALSDATKAAIRDLLTGQVTGAKTIELETTEDQSLLGGVVIRTSRHELDVSVRSQLKQISLGGTV